MASGNVLFDSPSKNAKALEKKIEKHLAPRVAYCKHCHSRDGVCGNTCNGCGTCRSTAPEVRMCPINRMNPREEASPRAKANLVRGLLAGQLPEDTLLQDVCKEVADLCVHCHMCRIECPANVDVPKMMLEAKASYVEING
ncbi:MAG: oxidase, partial [Anaerolineae bacterium]|nr:oxidase [Anaerolineae bacterium]